MNILVTSAGRRVKIIEYFKRNLKEINGKVIATDCDLHAPALYFADGYEIVPRINDPNYTNLIIDICKKYYIDAVISLIDPELEILAKMKSKFDAENVKLVLSPLRTLEMTFDKYETYRYLYSKGISTVPTYNSLERALLLLEEKQLSYPLIVKPAKGSASIGLYKAYNKQELKDAFNQNQNQIIQPFLKNKEYGIDVYIDMNHGQLVDMFIKEKIQMRSGETDKSISIHNSELVNLIKELIASTNFIGPIDIDVFESDGKYYISEINPRFGGGYPHAYEMGCNFMKYIINNLKGTNNDKFISTKYEEYLVMMKYDDLKII